MQTIRLPAPGLLTWGRGTSLVQPCRAEGSNLPKTNRLEDATKTAGLVAHELNNLLTVININTEFLLATNSDDPTSAEELQEIQRAAHRASLLARRLLASSRREPFDPGPPQNRKKRTPPRGTAVKDVTDAKDRVTETILLVEDEAGVRGLAKRVLTQREIGRASCRERELK